jgi:hypothetical protein
MLRHWQKAAAIVDVMVDAGLYDSYVTRDRI